MRTQRGILSPGSNSPALEIIVVLMFIRGLGWLPKPFSPVTWYGTNSPSLLGPKQLAKYQPHHLGRGREPHSSPVTWYGTNSPSLLGPKQLATYQTHQFGDAGKHGRAWPELGKMSWSSLPVVDNTLKGRTLPCSRPNQTQDTLKGRTLPCSRPNQTQDTLKGRTLPCSRPNQTQDTLKGKTLPSSRINQTQDSLKGITLPFSRLRS
eukprot:sb/3470378/